jgi:prepilin-type N-terminal cleavage/methylation domain-containing protein
MISIRSLTTNAKGFSMIELLVVATILVVLSTIGLVSYNQAGQSARNGKRQADLETLRQALVLYRVDNGTYPITGDYGTMMTTISEYISSPDIQDPRYSADDPTYQYEYSSTDGSEFTLSAFKEPDHTLFEVKNP